MHNGFQEFGRGQLEYALWRTFAPPELDAKEINKTFKARIKRLLEIDFSVLQSNRGNPLGQNLAFSAKPDVPGAAVKYTALDAICLGVALELIDMGYQQKQVVRLVQLTRPTLSSYFKEVLQFGKEAIKIDLAARTFEPTWLVDTFETNPTNSNEKQEHHAYLVIRAVELTVIDFEHKGGVRPITADFSTPILCLGAVELAEHIQRVNFKEQRSFTVLEIAYLSCQIILILQDAPEIARGRPPGS